MRDDHHDGEDNDYVRVDTHNNEKSSRSSGLDLAHRQPEGLEVDALASWQRQMLEDPKNQLALAALSTADPKTVLMSRAAKISDQHVFNVRIPFEGAPITNQRRSGRCWLFASTNTFRVALMKRYNLDSFELSQAYLFFWDKLEKANYFLENIIQTADQDLEGRLVQRLLQDPVSDGGQWDMAYNLIFKYGVCPQALYPDSFNAMSSSSLNYIVVAKLREYAITLRNIINNNNDKHESAKNSTASLLADAKAKMMREIQLILTVTLGPPPSSTDKFVWEYLDKDQKPHTLHATPLEFARDIWSPGYRVASAETIASLVSLVHDPRHEPLTLMTVDRLGNIVGGRGVTYINVSMADLKQACVATLRAGIPIFFGSDVGKFSNTAAGIMDLDLIDYRLGFNTDILGPSSSSSSSNSSRRESAALSKADRLRTGESAMTHAMVLTAVHVDEESGRPVRWRVQNSWGEDVGEKGWFVMSDAWMEEFVYQAVVHPKFLSREVRDVLKKEPVVLPLWDPMGALA
ncbi:peptidase C1B, bleomycin hydrolase [Microdochium trichocladiopsis]|uniref:Cysteine proteinase 1, mitochondrial n=1 Tax=Microdochium trichocladiopsis TaxID=1682393 RepID=A0A9P9BUD7_9PEZI|nr:peptidase C1B, bleomycin hydrolase [Microdochium trichocladiopsis]KAH7037364.1 peptidase C1B, bleomycin hydrolase [Microdochium trichocladiopsis]